MQVIETHILKSSISESILTKEDYPRNFRWKKDRAFIADITLKVFRKGKKITFYNMHDKGLCLNEDGTWDYTTEFTVSVE